MSTMHNPPATVDHEEFTVSRTITIAASIERVWSAITEPEHIERWHAAAASLTAIEPGGSGTWTFEGYGDAPVRVEAVEPMRSITYRWGTEGDGEILPGRSTIFTFTLEPIHEGTRLTVVERGFDELADPKAGLRSNQEGWTTQLDALVAYLEGTA